MHSPRFVCVPAVTVAALLLFGTWGRAAAPLVSTAMYGTQVCEDADLDEDQIDARQIIQATSPVRRKASFRLPTRGDFVRVTLVMIATMGISPFDLWWTPPKKDPQIDPKPDPQPQPAGAPDTTPPPPPDNPPPPVPPTPPPPPPSPPEASSAPPPEPPSSVPEPGTLVTALVGSSMLGFAAWRRKRQAKKG